MKRTPKAAEVPKYGLNYHSPFQVCLAKQTAAVWSTICATQLQQLDRTCPCSTTPFSRGAKKNGAGGDVKEPQNSWDSKVRSIPPFAVPGLHGQANNGRPKGNLCRPTPARCYITHAHTTHGHFFFLSNPPTAPGTTKRTPTAEGAPKYGPNRHGPF